MYFLQIILLLNSENFSLLFICICPTCSIIFLRVRFVKKKEKEKEIKDLLANLHLLSLYVIKVIKFSIIRSMWKFKTMIDSDKQSILWNQICKWIPVIFGIYVSDGVNEWLGKWRIGMISKIQTKWLILLSNKMAILLRKKSMKNCDVCLCFYLSWTLI